MNERARASINGIVQGVGFRPFIYRLAHRYRLSGYVANTSEGVVLEVEGPEKRIRRFFEALEPEHPPLARISSVERTSIPLKNDREFVIRSSRGNAERSALISPDVGVCPDCLAEMKDPGDRRFRYPFINCTNCGPRYTIIEDIPYDRASTTMRKFRMCRACRAEYLDPGNRRFHAQPNACPECGPEVTLTDASGRRLDVPDPVRAAVSLLEKGRILAVKGLGGFHLGVDAANHRAVVRLRRRKHREEKPLAVMVRDLETARDIVHINDTEARELTSFRRPIVILRKRRFHGLSSQVAPKNRFFGVMLPYTPLHHLLMEGGFRALVMTSGNMTDEPINIQNRAAFRHLGDIADFFLVHNRDIHLRSDDAIIRVIEGIPRQIRRSRGYVPVPVFLPDDMAGMPPVLAVGAELKNTICLTKENRAFLSQHIGDLDNAGTLDFFHMTVTHLRKILEARPVVLAHDLHPDYLSSRFARKQNELPTLAVQHHHAHIVSCLAENGYGDAVIGVALDGTGLGTDGHIWGGEILLADLTSFTRRAHLEYVPLPGGDAAARSPWRMALAYLDRAYGDRFFRLPIPFVRDLDREKADIIVTMGRKGINSPLTSSTGRFFDAVSALVGIRRNIAYEGQAAVELDMCQDLREKGGYPWDTGKEGGRWVIRTGPVIRGVVEDLVKGEKRSVISRRFHNTLIHMITETCRRIGDESGIRVAALSGGAFQNASLLVGVTRGIEAAGFRVMSHARVPTNDGGLSLGQAVCGGMRHAGMPGRFEEKA